MSRLLPSLGPVLRIRAFEGTRVAWDHSHTLRFIARLNALRSLYFQNFGSSVSLGLRRAVSSRLDGARMGRSLHAPKKKPRHDLVGSAIFAYIDVVEEGSM